MPTRQKFICENLYRREVDGRVLFPHAISAADVRYVWLAGQLAYLPNGQLAGHGDMRVQFRQACLNIKTALRAAGADLADVIKIVVYVTDMDEYFRCFDIRHEFFGDAFPVSSSLEVSRLPVPGAMVQIDVVAAIDAGPVAG